MKYIDKSKYNNKNFNISFSRLTLNKSLIAVSGMSFRMRIFFLERCKFAYQVCRR